MSRVRRGFKANRRRKKVFKLAKGFQFDRRTTYRQTAQTVVKALHNRYKSRRIFKREMRALWITRISAAASQAGTSYSKFMGSLAKKDILLNRKMLSEIAAQDEKGFNALVEAAK
jgi:large subunit ribosomal protein L20